MVSLLILHLRGRKYKVRTEHSIIKVILDARQVQALPYLSTAMKNRVPHGQTATEVNTSQNSRTNPRQTLLGFAVAAKKALTGPTFANVLKQNRNVVYTAV